MIYLDSCALIKLVRAEPGAAALARWLVRVELIRALQRLSASAEEHREATTLLDELTTRPVDSVLDDAARLHGQHLRSLDAIHPAKAHAAGGALTAFVSYDKRLATTAEEAGLPVVQPA